MARRIRDAALETRQARRRLETRLEPHWRALDKGLHLGYRKRPDSGTWTARRRNAAERYEEIKLGAADDYHDADGSATIDVWQAQEAARRWHLERTRGEQGLDPETGLPPEKADADYTVGDALKDYLAVYRLEGKSLAATEAVIAAHIKPRFETMRVAALSPKLVRDWLEKLAAARPRLRTAEGEKQAFAERDNNDDAKRARRSTANRVLTVLKAALNHAWREGKVASDGAWRKVKPFRAVDDAHVRYLKPDECKRLVNSCAREFRPLVQAALLTGCRYGELIALKSLAFDARAGTLNIPTSKSGKARSVVLTAEGQKFFEAVTASKERDALLFTKPDGSAWGKSHQHRPIKEACKNAKITPAISFHILRHTHASQLAAAGTPMVIVAGQLGHADTRITEKHYAHLAPSHVAETIRANFPKLGIVPKSNVRATGSHRKAEK